MNVTTQKQTPMGMMTAVKMPEARWVAAGGQKNCAGLIARRRPTGIRKSGGEECVVCVEECGGGGGPSGGQCGGGGGA